MGFAGEKELDLGSEVVSKDASLKKKLIFVREGLLDGWKEIEGMVSSLEEPINDIDRSKKMQEITEFASGYINGGFLAELSSLPPFDIPKENVPVCPASPDYVLDRPPSPEYVPGNLASPDYVPNCPPLPDYVPNSPEYVPGCPPSPEYVPGCPPSPDYVPNCPPSPEYVPDCPPSPEYVPNCPPSPDYVPNCPPSPDHVPNCPSSPSYVPNCPPSPDYVPNSLPSPTFVKEFGTGYWQLKPEWPIRLPSTRSSEDGDNNGQIPNSPNKHENHESSCTKRKAVDDWDLDSPALKKKRPRTEFADPAITEFLQVMAGGWLEEWVMIGTCGWLEN